MGVGKTSVGKELSALTGAVCTDTDELIVRRYGSIDRIFAERGEGYFRDLESEIAEELAKKDGLIVSTGGGFVLREKNARLLKKNGKIIFLRAELSTLLGRIGADDGRPLLKEGAERKLLELLPVRTPIYERAADHTVDTDGKTVADVAAEILEILSLTEKK